MGFKDTKKGQKFNKKYYGLHVIVEQDEQHAGRQQDAPLKKAPVGKADGDMLKDGFTRVTKKIEPAVQNQFQDDGKVKPIHPSTTFSGHVKKKGGE